jgi:hypothetical protein
MLNDIINLSISIESSNVTQEGFGTPLVLDYNTRYSDTLVHEYGSPADMITDDSFATTDEAYQAVGKIFSQDPSPSTVKVGRRTSPPSQRYELTPATAVSTVYSFNISVTGGTDQTVTYTSSATANAAEIINGLTAAVAAVNGYGPAALTASNQTTYLRIAGPASGVKFGINTVKNTFSAHGDKTPDNSIATDLANVLLEDDDWYAFMSTSKGAAEIEALAVAIQAYRKFFVAATQDSEVLSSVSTDDIGYDLNAAGYTRTALIHNDNHMDHPDAALLGRWLPYEPGSETVKFKQLTGITPTKHTTSQRTALRAKSVNFYETRAGVPIVMEGVTCEGEFMDTIRFVDWVYARISEEVFGLFVSEEKVPFTDPGIAQVSNAIFSVLLRGIEVGGFSNDPFPSITVPKANDVSAINRAARNLPDIRFRAQLAGAVHTVDITGTVSV